MADDDLQKNTVSPKDASEIKGEEKREPEEGAKLEDLEDYLNYLGKRFSEKRKEQTEKHFWLMVGISAATFVLVFLTAFYFSPSNQFSLPTFNQDNMTSQSMQNVLIDKFQFALVLSIAVAIIPLIVFSANNSRAIQYQNDELAALSLDIQRLRNRVLLSRQNEMLEERKIKEEKDKETKSRQKDEEIESIKREKQAIETKSRQKDEEIESIKREKQAIQQLKEEGQEVRRDINKDLNRPAELSAKIAEINKEIPELRKKIENDPIDPRSWLWKGEALFSSGEFGEAIEHFDKGIAIVPHDVNLWFKRGLALHYLLRYEEAINSFQKVIEINPIDVDAWLFEGDSLMGLGKYEEAIKCYDKAIEINPRSVVGLLHKASALAEIGNKDDERRSYQKATEIDVESTDVEGLMYKGLAFVEIGRYEDAIEHFNKILMIDPNNAYVLYLRALSQVKKGDIENSLASLEKATEIDKSLIEAAKQNKDFESIRNDERFKALIARGED